MSEKRIGKRVTLNLQAIEEEGRHGPANSGNDVATHGAAEYGDGYDSVLRGDTGAKKKRSRTRKFDEGDLKELKPRHLKGKRREDMMARTAANLEAAQARRSHPLPSPTDAAAFLHERLTRMLRPKARRWVMYEWFHSPVDYGWYRTNEFVQMLQQAGLGHITLLTRREWSFIRSLLGRVRRFSGSFIQMERQRLNAHRNSIRDLRRQQAAGHAAASSLDTEQGQHGAGATQMAVGQRVTAFHPKERHVYSGTVLTPDGDHYRVQFDGLKLGVQPVQDIMLMPLLDGSRGIEFTSPHGQLLQHQVSSSTPTDQLNNLLSSQTVVFMLSSCVSVLPHSHAQDGPAILEFHGDEAMRRASNMAASAAAAVVRADAKELQLLAYALRLLERKKLLIDELKAVALDGERELSRVGKQIEHAVAVGAASLHVHETDISPEWYIAHGERLLASCC